MQSTLFILLNVHNLTEATIVLIVECAKVLLFIVGISITQQINGETKIKNSLYLIKLYAMCVRA